MDQQKYPLSGKTAVITGGLGALATAAATSLLELGCAVALLYPAFEAHLLPKVIDTYPAIYHPRIKSYECDITSETSVEKAFDDVFEHHADGNLYILLNCAGIVKLSPLEQTPLKLFEQHISVNLTGPFLASKAFANRLLAKEKPGRIVSLASQAAHVALPQHGA
jgi:NAD(P)-dependent dehydrogenase (short-subunit alcohol dehydrogenase family)